MRRGAFRWRARDLSLMLLVLVCATILIWTWDRTPFLSAFLPPKSRFLELPTDDIIDFPGTNLVSWPLKSRPREEISSVAEDGTSSENDEKYVGIVHHKTKENDSFSTTPPINNEETGTSAEDSIKHKYDVTEEEKDVASEVTVSDVEIGEKETVDEKNSEQEKKIFEVVEPISEAMPARADPHRNSTVHVENQACNYARGKWVIDDRHPLYSGFGCKQWLAPMWACRLMQRKDFAFEKLRWQPKACEMEEFEGSKFLTRMQNKTLAFVGDSLGRQQFQSLMCMITGGKERPDVLDVGSEYGLVTPKGGSRPNGWAYRFPETNTTVLYYWSATLCDIQPLNITDPKTEYAMHLDRPPEFLRQYLNKIHVLVLNTGHHWNRGKLNGNRWVIHVGGIRNTDKKLAPIGNAKNFTIHSIVSWVNTQLPKYPGLKAFYRSISPRHFVGGDWNTGGSCNNTTPMSIGKEVLQDESSDHSAGRAVKGTGVKLLDITAPSQVRDEAHISRFSLTASSGVQDCLHWCLPGVPDAWNEILFTQI